ncbi:MAG: Rid family detoxifying hydrolase [Bacteroidia bacterium]|jgi:2-iminobutanoate/2-iminopropanoate deaminase
MKYINTPHAPAPIGPYSQAVVHNGMLFVSGQIAIDPATGNMIQDHIEAEAEQVMKNLQAILNAAGTNFRSVLKTTILLSDMAHFSAVNSIYGRFFEGGAVPARETFAAAGLPLQANIEISMVVAIE